MTDTSDNEVLRASYTSEQFQGRCRFRFINAAIAVGTEVLPLTATLAVPTGSVLTFASTTGVLVGMSASDLYGAAIIPAGTLVRAVTATTVTLTNAVAGGGLLLGDVINFAPVSHVQRLAFAGALFTGNVDLAMLAMAVLANATNRTNCLANPNIPGGNILDSDIDFQVNSVLTGIATSRGW